MSYEYTCDDADNSRFGIMTGPAYEGVLAGLKAGVTVDDDWVKAYKSLLG